jgi:hypothetical protein
VIPDSEEEWDAKLESLDGYDWEDDGTEVLKEGAVVTVA